MEKHSTQILQSVATQVNMQIEKFSQDESRQGAQVVLWSFH